MKKKVKGQITLFVIIAIIIICIIVLFFLEYPNLRTKINLRRNMRILESKVNDCLELNLNQALILVGLTGGNVGNKNFSTVFLNISYYYYNGSNLMPTLKNLEKEISNYIEENIDDCIDFSSFPFEIETGKKEIKTEITEKNVKTRLEYPLTIKLENFEIKKSNFEKKENIRLGTIYNASKSIIDSTIEDPDYIDIEKIFNLEKKYDLQIDSLIYEKSVIYQIQDKNSLIKDSPYLFYFAVKI